MADKGALDRLRRLLAAIAEGSVDPRSTADKAMTIVDGLLGRAGRGQADVQYTVEDTVNGIALTERRRGATAHPLRCPQAVYDALVAIMANSDRSLPLDELVVALAGVLGDQPPDYQVRIPLRLWLHVQPPLIVRNRARYKPIHLTQFTKSSKTVWKSLEA